MRSVLLAFAFVLRDRRAGSDLASLLHRDPHVAQAERHVRNLVRDLIGEAIAAREVRDDIDAHELAQFALSALGAAPELRSKAAVQRLVDMTLAGLRAGA